VGESEGEISSNLRRREDNIVVYRLVGVTKITRVLVRMIGFISTLVTSSLNHSYYSAVADLRTFQFTVAYAIGLSV
jgi:hypothetical protein